MEKRENLTIEDLRVAIDNGNSEEIISIAEELDLKKIKDNNILSQVADAYSKKHMYSQEKRALELAYENTNAGRNLAYRLCLVAVKTKDFSDAKEYYEDFVEMAPRDTGRYILKYKMAKAQNMPLEKLIDILEEYVNIDMEERWAYELAKLYHMVGDEEKCIDMCDEVSLWFSDGKYVLKAMELKKKYQPLTASQQQRYDMAYAKQQADDAEKEKITEKEVELPKEDTVSETVEAVANDSEEIWFDESDEVKEVEETPEFPEIEIKTDDPSRFNTVDMQAVIASGMKEVVLDLDDNTDTEEAALEEPVFNDLNDVSAFLKELQERGVLKAETVSQAVNIIEGQDAAETVKEESEEIEDIVDKTVDETNQDNIDIEAEEKESVIVETTESDNNDALGVTKEIGSSIAKEAIDILEQPTNILPSVKEVEKAMAESEKVEVSSEGVPVFDLSFAEIAPPEDIKVSEELQDKADTAEEEVAEKEATEVEVPVEPEDSSEVGLTDEELDAFKNYVNVEGFDSNIKEVLRDLIANYQPNGKSENGNIMILGNEKTGKTTLAIEIIKLVNKKRGRRNRRLAKVDANALNKRGFRNALNKLLGSDLIIENANVLGVMTISEIIDVCGMFTDDMLIILEGDADGMDILIKNAPRISSVFNHIVRIKEYDIKEWVEYGKEYALEQGYTMDELANLAFFKVIDDFYGANKGISQGDIEDIVNSAITRSNKLGRKLFGNKKDDEGYAILVEKDFNI